MFSPSPRPWASGEFSPGGDSSYPQVDPPGAEKKMGTGIVHKPDGGNPVLKALDQAKTQSYHFKAIIIAGMGFFTDSYDLFVIGLLTKLLGRIYYNNEDGITPGTLPINVNAAVVSTAFCGTLAGQLFFGWAGDKWGRKKVYGLTLALMVVASIGQGLSFGHTNTSVLATLCFFRFWLGFGVGGDYPLSATIMSEYSNTKTRGAFVAAVFAMQGIGYLSAAAVTIIITETFRHKYPSTDINGPPQADWVWRLILMVGAVPAALTFYSRSKMPETARYTALIERDEKQAALDMEKVLGTHFDDDAIAKTAKVQTRATEFGLLTRQFAQRHGKELFGCCVTWFLLDVSYYSQNLFQTQVFSAVGWVKPASTMGALKEVYVNAKWTALLALFSTVPGYWFTVATIDRVGRKPIQLMGFFMMSVFMFILGIDFYNLRGHVAGDYKHTSRAVQYTHGGNHIAFIVLYAFTFFFSNFGPNATTFIVPSELFPARLRSTCHGIASATGKAGAIVGAFGFIYASQDNSHGLPLGSGYTHKGIGYRASFILLAVCAVVGFIVTVLCIPETKGRSLEDLSGEDEDNNAVGRKVENNSSYA